RHRAWRSVGRGDAGWSCPSRARAVDVRRPAGWPDHARAAGVGTAVTVTGVANLAVKVSNLDEAVAFYRAAGATVTDPEEWRGGRRADVALGPLAMTLFTRAVYEDDVDSV